MSTPAFDWPHLGEVVRARRNELGLTQVQVADRGGPSTALLRSLENGRARSMSWRVAADLELVLGWKEGSVESVLIHGAPMPLEAPVRPAAPTQLGQMFVIPDPSADRHREVLERLDRIIGLLEALTPSPRAGSAPRGEAARPESPTVGDHGDPGRATNFP